MQIYTIMYVRLYMLKYIGERAHRVTAERWQDRKKIKYTAIHNVHATVYRSSAVERPGARAAHTARLVFPAAVENEIVSEAVSSLSLLPTHG